MRHVYLQFSFSPTGSVNANKALTDHTGSLSLIEDMTRYLCSMNFFFFLPQKTKSLPTEILQVSTAMLQKSALEYRVRELVKSDGRG